MTKKTTQLIKQYVTLNKNITTQHQINLTFITAISNAKKSAGSAPYIPSKLAQETFKLAKEFTIYRNTMLELGYRMNENYIPFASKTALNEFWN